jgi:hypothetical protein
MIQAASFTLSSLAVTHLRTASLFALLNMLEKLLAQMRE